MQERSPAEPRFAIYRASDAPDLEATGVMTGAMPTELEIEGSKQLADLDYSAGHQLKLLYSAPGISLARAWFKSGFPLPRHTHNCDCLYYIIAGSIKLGAETLGAGDGFFVGAEVPYAYTPGEDGVELLEFRTADHFDIKIRANNPAFWAKAVATVTAKHDVWLDEVLPTR
jgi:hypothetical protein